jgi:AraC family transcriptional regulator of adaptative response / DNA-3-methyladenine glycosylase II
MLLIRQGALNEGSLEGLAAKLGVGSRHLRRLFQTHIGASPKNLATTQKILFAKKLLTETDLSVTRIAFASGFGSIRRFNAAFSKTYGTTPSAIRRRNNSNKTTGSELFQCTLILSYRPPYQWQRMLEFFELRAIPGVEFVAGGVYSRTIRINETTGVISVAHGKKPRCC